KRIRGRAGLHRRDRSLSGKTPSHVATICQPSPVDKVDASIDGRSGRAPSRGGLEREPAASLGRSAERGPAD
ncbi:MAG: hypothetical protein ACREQJ_00550, partial [Candidatus Binatia bacterium]